ncbi:nuclear transport factor 2 family protein [Streptomyces synnematoformans]|uniref:Nuclear transport factor 2 family protein n=1 Tax=Streptomyces synnematoformans TaxID=415721 RepID=A0ABN2XCN5_9ACTN
MRIRTGILAASTAVLLTLTACGSDDEGDAGDGATQAGEAALRKAVQDRMDAVNDGNVDAIQELTSTRCREKTSKQELTKTIDLTNTLYGDIELKSLDILEINEDSAVVKGTTGIEALDKPQPGDDEGARWALEDGHWRTDDC